MTGINMSPAVSDTLKVEAGRAAEAETRRKLPAVLLEGKETEMSAVAFMLPLAAFCKSATPVMAAVALKLLLALLAPFMITVRLSGLNVKPLLEGVTV